MGKSIFIDLTQCTGCRACQLTCGKRTSQIAGEADTGIHQNPADLSDKTVKLVRFSEVRVNGDLRWLFFPEQCRHCHGAPCKRAVDRKDKKAVLENETTGAVLFTDRLEKRPTGLVRQACPYDIPRGHADGLGAVKCDFCLDRITRDLVPVCVQSCRYGAMRYGDEEEVLELAEKRLSEVREKYPKAYLGDPGNVRVLYLYFMDHRLFYQDALD